MTRFVICLFAAIADLILCLSVVLIMPMIVILDLSDDGKFPLSVYAWKSTRE
jgi:hypothetical protein